MDHSPLVVLRFKIISTMNCYYKKTPSLGEGLAKNVMRLFLTQIKHQRGLTTFIEHHGVNGRWLKPEDPCNIRFTKLMKIMESKAHYQTDDEFLDDWNAAGEYFLSLVRTPHHLIKYL